MIHESEDSEVQSPLKALRGILGVTQEQFAHLIGVSVRTVSRWERGDNKVSFTPGQWKTLMAEMARVNLTVENLPDDLSPGNHLIFSKGS